MPRSLEHHLKDVNPEYIYEPVDMRVILISRVKWLRENNKSSDRKDIFKKPILVSKGEFIDDEGDNLTKIILSDQKKMSIARILLIPCGIDNNWVGVLLEISADNKKATAIYLDSEVCEGRQFNEAIAKQIHAVYPQCTLEVKKCWQREYSRDSAVYAIENLLCAALNNSLLLEERNSKTMRAEHLESLHAQNQKFYNDFLQRQHDDTPLVVPSDTPNLSVVPKSMHSLFSTIITLGGKVERLFSDKLTKSQFIFPAESIEMFQTVCDGNGNLRLMLKDTAKNGRLVKFRSTHRALESFNGFIWDYTPSGAIVFSGVPLSFYTGTGIRSAVQAWRSSLNISAGLNGVWAAANPWAFGATVVLTLGTAASTYEAREFARQIHNAAQLADSGNIDSLKEALDILELEFGKSTRGKSFIRRGLRWPRTPAAQFQFAHLLLTRIHEQLKLPEYDHYTKYEEIMKAASNDFIEGMCLVAQLNILIPKAALINSGDGDKLVPNKEMRLMEEKVKLLNHPKHNDLTQQYFLSILNAFMVVYEIVKTQNFIRNEIEFSKAKISLDKLIDFKDLHCLRFMGENGPIAEICFVFMQALCYAIYEKHYENVKVNDYVSKMKENSDNALLKLSECEGLIQLFLSNPISSSNPSLIKGIIEVISDYTRAYRTEHQVLQSSQDLLYSHDQIVTEREAFRFLAQFKSQAPLNIDEQEAKTEDILRRVVLRG